MNKETDKPVSGAKSEPDPALTERYKDNPSLENYLQLRREHPDAQIDIVLHKGIDQFVGAEADMISSGINSMLFLEAIACQPESRSALCFNLLEKLAERHRIDPKGNKHAVSNRKAIRDPLINHIAIALLEDIQSRNPDVLPADLVVLIRHQILRGRESEYLEKSGTQNLRATAELIGSRLLEVGARVSANKVAKILNVATTTITALFPNGTLEERSAKLLEMRCRLADSATSASDMTKEELRQLYSAKFNSPKTPRFGQES